VTERGWRTIAAVMGISTALILLTAFEQRRAVAPPSGWSTVAGPPALMHSGVPRLANSRWRLGSGAAWRADATAKEWFLRVRVPAQAVLSVETADGVDGVALRLRRDAVPAVVAPDGSAAACEGALPGVSTSDYPLVLTRTVAGIVLASGDHRMACAGALVQPTLRAIGATVELRSLGADGRPVGQPLSPLEWLGGVALLGFLWMVLVELERSRRVPWPIVILTSVPVLVGVVVLFARPSATVDVLGGIGWALLAVPLMGVLKMLAILKPRARISAVEE
jgi:hypothetical protein